MPEHVRTSTDIAPWLESAPTDWKTGSVLARVRPESFAMECESMLRDTSFLLCSISVPWSGD